MHTEHNVWLNTLDIIYHEAMQRGTMENFLKVLAGPQTEAKLKIPGLASTTAQNDKPGEAIRDSTHPSLTTGSGTHSRNILNIDTSAGLNVLRKSRRKI